MLPKRILIRARWLVAAAVLPLAASSLVAPAESSPMSQPAVGHSATAAPKRVVFIVLDQLRPEFIDAFDMENVKALMAAAPASPTPTSATWRRKPWSATT